MASSKMTAAVLALAACLRCNVPPLRQRCSHGHLFDGLYCSHERTVCPECGEQGDPAPITAEEVMQENAAATPVDATHVVELPRELLEHVVTQAVDLAQPTPDAAAAATAAAPSSTEPDPSTATPARPRTLVEAVKLLANRPLTPLVYVLAENLDSYVGAQVLATVIDLWIRSAPSPDEVLRRVSDLQRVIFNASQMRLAPSRPLRNDDPLHLGA